MSGMVGAVVGTLSLTAAGRPLYAYFAAWLAFVPLTWLLAIGVALAPGSSVGGSLNRALAGAAVALLAVAVWSETGLLPVSDTTGSGPWPSGLAATATGRLQTLRDTAELASAMEGVLEADDHSIELDLASPPLWPFAAGAVLDLEQRGIHTTIEPASWQVYFGLEQASGPSPKVSFRLGSPSEPNTLRGTWRTLPTTGADFTIAYNRTDSG
jgi:hypothetical protein